MNGTTIGKRGPWFGDDLLRPALAVVAVVVTAVELARDEVVARPVAVPLFVVVALLSVSTIAPWQRIPPWVQVTAMAVYAVTAAVLLPLAQGTLAPAFAFLVSAVAGAKLASQAAAVAVAVLNALTCAAAVGIVDAVAPRDGQWPWWLALSVGLPVYIGISRKDRRDALASAERAAVEARRAAAAEAREAALLERGRIARELHDVLGHSLTGIALQLDLADALAGKDRTAEAGDAVRRARSLAVDGIGRMRAAVHELHEDTPLAEALAGLGVDLKITGTPAELDQEATTTLLRAAQEALTNAAKHAPGSDRTMTLTWHEDAVTLRVHNGPPTHPPAPGVAGGTGLGLPGMRDRTKAAGGTLKAGPTKDGGWRVELRLPLA